MSTKTNNNSKTSINNLRDLNKAIASTTPRISTGNVVSDLLDMYASEFAIMDQATAMRDEALQLSEMLVNMKATHQAMLNNVSASTARRFTIERLIAKAKEEANAAVQNSSEANKLRVWMKDHGREEEWKKSVADAITGELEAKYDKELAELDFIKANALQWIEDAKRLGLHIDQTIDTINRLNKDADELVKGKKIA